MLSYYAVIFPENAVCCALIIIGIYFPPRLLSRRGGRFAAYSANCLRTSSCRRSNCHRLSHTSAVPRNAWYWPPSRIIRTSFFFSTIFLSKNYLYSTGSSSQVRSRPISFLIVPLGTVMENPSRSSFGTQRLKNLPLFGLLWKIISVPSLSTANQTVVLVVNSIRILSSHLLNSLIFSE